MRWGMVRRAALGSAIVGVALLGGAAASRGGSVGAQTPSAPAAAEEAASTVSAVGVARVSADGDQSSSLSVAVEQRSEGTDVKSAVAAVQAKVASLRAALQSAGVPASSMRSVSFNIGPQYGGPYPYPVAPPGVAVPATPAPAPDGAPIKPPGPPPISGYFVNAQLQVDTTGPEQTAAAIEAAIASGATSVNTFGKGPRMVPPSGEAMAGGVREATAQARALAEASAQASGQTLGSVRSVSVLPPVATFEGPFPAATWQVQVKVTYNVR